MISEPPTATTQGVILAHFDPVRKVGIEAHRDGFSSPALGRGSLDKGFECLEAFLRRQEGLGDGGRWGQGEMAGSGIVVCR